MKNLDSFYKRATGLLKQYELFTTKQSREMAEMQASGRYSKSYLSAQQEKAGQARQHERQVVAERLDGLRAEFGGYLDEVYDPEAENISPNLIALLGSGVEFTPAEWSRMAANHRGNMMESRLLADSAKQAGYFLDCYSSREDVQNNFDEYCRRVNLSLDDDMAGRFFTDSVAAEIESLSRVNSLLQHSFDCEKIETGPDAAVSKEIAKQRQEAQAGFDDAAFRQGFTGEAPRDPRPVDGLTAQEREIAAEAAGADGITEKIAGMAKKAVQDTMFPPKSADGSTTATEAAGASK